MTVPSRGVAVIGLGIMGGAIARNLAAAGFAVRGFDTDPGRLAALPEIVACRSAAGPARARR
jgi:2-hydroxy-3-oxopropionate reductase